MRKANLYKYLYAASGLLVLGFVIRFGVDVFRYDAYNGSAPLYAYALVRAVEYLLPSLAFFVAAKICKKKLAKKEGTE